MNDQSIPLCVPSIGAEELALLGQCVADNFVSSVGPFVSEFEEHFASFCEVGHAVATSSGTTALHLAMVVQGVQSTDLVAVSDFTFVASANAVSYTGADLLLVDSESATWNMNTGMLYDEVIRRAAAGERLPRLIEIVHVLGHPADLEPLLALRDEFGIGLVEDAAESLGATFAQGEFAGKQAGAVSEVGCFSFNGNKIMTTGSGGMLVSNNEEIATRARHLSTQAKLPGPGYFHDEVGFNYRMSNVTAALGVAQLRKLPDFLEAKRANAQAYGELLDSAVLELPPSADFADPTYWLYTIRVKPEQRDGLIEALSSDGISARSVWSPVSDQKPYVHCETLGSGVSDALWRSAVSLPSSVDLTPADISRVAAAVNDYLKD